jgi:hypothetical protein
MGVDVQVKSERGEVLGEVLDPQGLTARLLPEAGSDSLCLRFVDPYGDAIFNSMQWPTLIGEIRRAMERLPERDAAARDHADSILRLLEAPRDRVHTYVWFVGD